MMTLIKNLWNNKTIRNSILRHLATSVAGGLITWGVMNKEQWSSITAIAGDKEFWGSLAAIGAVLHSIIEKIQQQQAESVAQDAQVIKDAQSGIAKVGLVVLGMLVGLSASAQNTNETTVTSLSVTNGVAKSLGFTTSPAAQSLLNEIATNLPYLKDFQYTNLVIDGNFLESSGKIGGEGNLLYPIPATVAGMSPLIGIGAMYYPDNEWVFQFISVKLTAGVNISLGGITIPLVMFATTSSGIALSDTSKIQALEEVGGFIPIRWTKNITTYQGYGQVFFTGHPSAKELIFAIKLWNW